ncbi:hypothetical protein [endosymbiont DhMRE of Dentiscutata heterogama]|uniref:hypothetical protein n=1 Tax=endosymbiont DhMRE of Dentiscutata heterogama TaxID=1609546 RepID=UPI002AD34BED|nr:hypothetical protein [endosymbiont DhMRE of Dentiscutata heterogama]
MTNETIIKYHRGKSRTGKIICWLSKGRQKCFYCHLNSLSKENRKGKVNNSEYFKKWVEKTATKRNKN